MTAAAPLVQVPDIADALAAATAERRAVATRLERETRAWQVAAVLALALGVVAVVTEP